MAAASPVLQLGLLRMRPFNAGWNHGFHTTHGVTDACTSGWIRPVWQPWPPGRTHVDEEGRGHGVGHTGKLSRQTPPTQVGGRCAKANRPSAIGRRRRRLPHQLLGNASSLSSLPVFPARPNRTPCADSLRQHVRGVLYKSPGRCLLEALYSGRAPSGMGSAQPALAEGSTPAGQTEPRSGYVISEQCPLRGVDAPSAVVQKIWKTFGKAEVDLFASKDTLTAQLIIRRTGTRWPTTGPTSSFMHSPRSLLPQVVRRVREQGHKVLLVAPLWRNQPWLSELTQLLTAAPWPVPLRRDLLSQANGTIWHPRPELWALHLWPLNGSLRPPRASVKHHFWG